jgi:hypothetical protein
VGARSISFFAFSCSDHTRLACLDDSATGASNFSMIPSRTRDRSGNCARSSPRQLLIKRQRQGWHPAPSPRTTTAGGGGASAQPHRSGQKLEGATKHTRVTSQHPVILADRQAELLMLTAFCSEQTKGKKNNGGRGRVEGLRVQRIVENPWRAQ